MSVNNKILFIINGLGFGGAETQLIRLSKALLDKGFSVSIITLTSDLALLDQLDTRIEHINIPLNRNLKLLGDIQKILKLIKNRKPDVIHSHLFQANIISRLIKFFNKKIKVINTTHGSYLLDTRSYSPYKVYRYLQSWVDFHTAVSQEVLGLLLEHNSISEQKSIYIPNGLFVKEYYKNKSELDVFRWLSIGRFHPVKDYVGLIKICAMLKEENINFELHIAGDGEERNELEKLIHKNHLGHQVRLLGIVEDIPKLLSLYDAFVISSYSEGLPMVLLEAMSASLPVVSTDVGEIGNIIKQSKGGIVAPPKRQKDLRNAMLEMMHLDRRKLTEWGNNNRAFVGKHYDMDELVDTWIDLYFKNN